MILEASVFRTVVEVNRLRDSVGKIAVATRGASSANLESEERMPVFRSNSDA